MQTEVDAYIDELYEQNMWITEIQKIKLRQRVHDEGWSIEDIDAAVERNREQAISRCARILDKIDDKDAYYCLDDLIYPAGSEVMVRVRPRFTTQRLTGTYTVVISPYYTFDYHPYEKFEPQTLTVEAHDNAIEFSWTFDHEDMYLITVAWQTGERSCQVLRAHAYALDSDLFGMGFYKADLHCHTTFSDGCEAPELTAASARECGLDIIAVTDHNEFLGSVIARERAEQMGLDLTVILGEEYSLGYSPMHILALGTEEAIDRRFITRRVFDTEEAQRIMADPPELTCDVRAYAGTQALLAEVRRLGGVSILAHPYWKPIWSDGSRMDTPENLYIELGKHRRFDGIELVSGSPRGEHDTTAKQVALAQEIFGRFDGVPLLGITDSHKYTSEPIAGEHFTVVIAPSREADDVLEALRAGRCVAVEVVDGVPLCFGTSRLVKLASFLTRWYFPARDRVARREGEAAKMRYLIE